MLVTMDSAAAAQEIEQWFGVELRWAWGQEDAHTVVSVHVGLEIAPNGEQQTRVYTRTRTEGVEQFVATHTIHTGLLSRKDVAEAAKSIVPAIKAQLGTLRARAAEPQES